MLPAGGTVMPSMEDSMQGIPMQSGRPLSVCSVSSCGGGPSPPHRGSNGLYSNCNGSNPQEELMNDELLMSLSVRELNKRLHGCPREEVSQVSHLFIRAIATSRNWLLKRKPTFVCLIYASGNQSNIYNEHKRDRDCTCCYQVPL